MKYLYLLLNLGSISIPFLYSFHPKLKFYKFWKALALAMLITMLIFIPWDVIFTKNGFWGFNDDYFIGLKFLSLPLEEWLFFICIPYACVFTHYALLHYFPNMKVSKATAKWLSILLSLLLIGILVFNYNKWYTLINYAFAIVLIQIVLKANSKLLQHYYLTFLVMLIPFFIVNGILTGSFIQDEVVWYNNTQNLGIRLFTIPVEDVIYAFSLILCNLFLTELFLKRTSTISNS
ncbi:lycopene cyclase domain-containing protein [Winogradskyella sp. 3972H.M.0a.05]|uniref:lycopene cyclase domain-containing protein n=1 Tax=Winogradskyella sp. 3972H.M.0a.05 TaxID=2950277 RepID=UPI0033934102